MSVKCKIRGLPTKANLMTRGIIDPDAQLCVAGCGEVETTQHLLVSCPIFSGLWHLVHAWVGVSGVDPVDVSAHFLQFSNLIGGASTRRSFKQLLWLLCVWVLCTERNNKQFNNTEISIHQCFEKFQIHYYVCGWIKVCDI